MGRPKKTIIVGLDAACWDYLTPLLRSGQMPTLRSYINSGISGTMYSTMPPWTPAAWSSIITGKNPGKHGIYDLLWKRPGSYDFFPINATHRYGTPFWKYLNDQGVRTGLINVPFTYPPGPLDGFVLCGFGTPNTVSDFAYPAEIGDWIRKEYKNFKPEVDAEFLAMATPNEIFEVERNQQALFVKITEELVSQNDVDILVINLMFPDHANHKMPDMEQVHEAYRQTDKDLAKLIDAFQPDNVMIFSDHGSNRLQGDFLLDLWLRDNGYYIAQATTSEERSATLNWLLTQYYQEHLGLSGPLEKILRRLTLASIFKLPKGLSDIYWDRVESVFPHTREYLKYKGIPDYSSTTVFPGSVYSGLLYINIVGRESNGVIPLEEKENIANEIITKLLRIENPLSGERLLSNVYLAEELYDGYAAKNAPDLILDGYQGSWNMRMRKDFFPSPPTKIVDRYFATNADRRDFGWHTRDGIFVFSGPDFINGAAPFEPEILDIPAILLHLYGVPIPDDFDGTVRTNAMIEAHRERPILYQSGDNSERDEKVYTPEEVKALTDHFRALGYLD